MTKAEEILGHMTLEEKAALSIGATAWTTVPIEQQNLSLRDLRLYGFVAVFSAGNLLLPMAVHTLPQGGLIFLPIFLRVSSSATCV